MKDLVNGQSLLDTSVTEVVHALCTISDELLPHLKPAEQIVYLRLFRLSYMRQNPYTRCRYEDIATQCGLSLRTLQRALKGLRQKKLVSTVWQSHGATTFSVQNYAVLTYRPAFLPRRRRNPGFEPLTPPKTRPPVYDAFSREDRELFLACKRSLSPQHLNDLTEQAVEWLTARNDGDPEAFSDDLLRDKVDELVFQTLFGPERQKPYEALFQHLYEQSDTHTTEM